MSPLSVVFVQPQPQITETNYRDKDAVATCSSRGGRLTSLSCSQRGFTICESGELPNGLSRCEVATRNRRPPTLSPTVRMLQLASSRFVPSTEPRFSLIRVV